MHLAVKALGRGCCGSVDIPYKTVIDRLIDTARYQSVTAKFGVLLNDKDCVAVLGSLCRSAETCTATAYDDHIPCILNGSTGLSLGSVVYECLTVGNAGLIGSVQHGLLKSETGHCGTRYGIHVKSVCGNNLGRKCLQSHITHMGGLALLSHSYFCNSCLTECHTGLNLTAVTLAAAGICAGSETQGCVLGRNRFLAASLCKSQINSLLDCIR